MTFFKKFNMYFAFLTTERRKINQFAKEVSESQR